MRLQELPYSCGAASVVNVLRAFDIRVREREVRRVASTTKEGTDEKGVLAALRHYGLQASDATFAKRGDAWSWAHGNLVHGRPLVLCADFWSHWVCVIGMCGDRVVLVDPMKTRSNRLEGGVHVLSHTRLMRRWRGPERSLYGISVGR